MLADERIKKLAHNLVNYSCALKKGEKLLVESIGEQTALVTAVVNEAYAVGAVPVVRIKEPRVERALLMGMSKEAAAAAAKFDCYLMDDMDAYIGIRGGNNAYENSDVPSDKAAIYSSVYQKPVHHDRRVKHTKWVILRYPSAGMSEMSATSTEAFEDYYFEVCNLDYAKMNEAMTPLVTLMEGADKVRIVAPNTDLTFSIKGIGAVKCAGERNIPDGEVYTAPVKNSVNGRITYNVPTAHDGMKFDGISLLFEDGKIVAADCASGDKAKLAAAFDTDEGARYVGEFSFGLNPYITKAIGDILFDEKIAGSIHFTPGACYDEAPNGNNSALHWDLVLNQTKAAGGGEIWLDGVLVRKDGIFVLPRLEGLNPARLK